MQNETGNKLTGQRGHRIRELPIGRTHAYKLINEGKLQAKKSGNVTIVTNWPEYVDSLPALREVG
jgi:hypothetical protein